MTIPQLMPWIGGAAKFDGPFSALVCPIDDNVESEIIESDAKVIDAAVRHAHAAFLKHGDATMAKRVAWLNAAADAIDRIESELVRSLIRFIGKPRRAATFEAKRVGAFIRACAAQLPHLAGEGAPARCGGRRCRPLRLHHACALRRDCGSDPVQRTRQPADPEGRAGARGGQRHCRKALATRHGSRASARAGHEGGRHPRRALQRADARRRDCSPRMPWSLSSPSPAALPRATSSRAPREPRSSSASSAPTRPISYAPMPILPTPRPASQAPLSKRAASNASRRSA
jgi:Aldehyde dehydrogenase family